MSEHISVTDDGAIRIIRFDRADKKNAITRAMYAGMAEALNEADASASIRCVVIAGSPGTFTAGNDLMDFMSAPPEFGADEAPPVQRFMQALMGCSRPVIAAVDGLAIGIGVTLLLHCDLVYASDRSSFKTPFVDLALAPEFGSSAILPGLVGRAVASDLLLLGSAWDAKKAAANGLLTGVFPTGDLEHEVMDRARALAAKAPGAVRAAKALMRLEGDRIEDRILTEGREFSRLLQSEEFKEAATAFMERRPPDFSRFG
jgi:enoyl-CoA hydratase/carnithine racemase